MKKGPNKTSSCRFTLPKSKILRGRTNFQRLFEKQAVVFKSSALDVRFRVYKADEPEYKMAFIVPKRLGKAVRRNRMKRLMKEAFRLNQYLLTGDEAAKLITFHGALMAKKTDRAFGDVEADVKKLLEKTRAYIRNLI